MSRIIRCSVCGGLCNPDQRCMGCRLLPRDRDQSVERIRAARAEADFQQWQRQRAERERKGRENTQRQREELFGVGVE